MLINKLLRSFLLTTGASLAMACIAGAADPPAPPAETSAPTATAPATATPAAASQTPAAAAAVVTPEAKAETDAATHLEKKFQEAARSYRKVEKNGETMYCKKEKPINSTIPRLQCITEGALRLQVEQMDDLRDRMRNSARCTHGAGCSSGG